MLAYTPSDTLDGAAQAEDGDLVLSGPTVFEAMPSNSTCSIDVNNNSRGYERIKGLEAALTLRRNEAEALRQRREELKRLAAERAQFTAGIAMGRAAQGEGEGDTCTLPKALRKNALIVRPVASSAGAVDHYRNDGYAVEEYEEEDPTHLPIVSLCTAKDGSFSIDAVPPERFGDTCVEMEVATDSLQRHAVLIRKTVTAIEVENKMYEKQQNQLTEQLRLMSELTGVPLASASARAAGATARSVKRDEESMLTSNAPGHRTLRILEADHSSAATVSGGFGDEAANNKVGTTVTGVGVRALTSGTSRLVRAKALVSARGASSAADSATKTASGSVVPLPPGPSTALELKQKNDELRRYVQALTKETREAKAVMLKKEKVLKDLMSQLDSRKSMEEETSSFYNAIRVKDRDVKERKSELRSALEEHDRIDALINDVAAVKSTSSIGAMDKDLAVIRARVTECVEEERRLQDRVSKAQEYRIAMLYRRINLIVNCVKSHRLDTDVEMLIAATLELQRQQDMGAARAAEEMASQQQRRRPPVSSSTATATQSSGSMTSLASRAGMRTTATGKPLVNSGQLVIAGATHKQAAHEIASLKREELYDIDTIIPPNETIHPAIYSIFVSEKEQLARRAVTTKLIAEEKMAAVGAQRDKADVLEDKRTRLDEKLRRGEKDIKIVEDQKKLDLLEEVTGNRTLLQQAIQENVFLRKLVIEKKPIAVAAQAESERRELRRSTFYGSGGGVGGSPSSRGGLTPPANTTPMAQNLHLHPNRSNINFSAI